MLVAVIFVLGVVGCSDSDEGDKGGGAEILLSKTQVAATDISQFAEVVCDGTWTISFDYPEGTPEWCSTPNPSGQGNAKIVLEYGKNTSDEARTVTIRLKCGSKVASALLTQNGKSGGTNPEPGPNPSPSKGWMELPEVMSQSGCLFLTHWTTISNRNLRNFSLYFDTDERIAYWVAYPLCEAYLGSQGRTDAFQPDPEIPEADQMTSTISGYDRGHQIPSGDRTVNYNANMQTFYYSNMTPQLGKFNQKIWVDLEGKVRGWAKGADTLYVVTGAVLQTAGGNETVKYVSDKSGHRIAVPNYYFKVLLRLTINGTSRNYKSIAFWFRHAANDGPVSVSDALTVDEVERKTGINFFVNLPAETERTVEAQFAPQDWGL